MMKTNQEIRINDEDEIKNISIHYNSSNNKINNHKNINLNINNNSSNSCDSLVATRSTATRHGIATTDVQCSPALRLPQRCRRKSRNSA